MPREALFEGQRELLPAGEAVKAAITGCIPGAQNIRFDARRLELLVDILGQSPLPITNLRSGQKSMLALVGDLAQRMARLNPQLGRDALH
jgi:predicted ATP-binding protein involved in virulence